MGLDFQNLAYQGQNLDQFGPNLAVWANLLVFELQSSFYLSSVHDFSKFYNDIEKLNVLAFGERHNLKSQEKTIRSVHSY